MVTIILVNSLAQDVYRCQEVSAWWVAFGIRFVPHQAVRLWTSKGQKVIHLNAGCDDFEKDICFGNYDANDWEEDEDPVDARSGVTVQGILDNVPSGYHLIQNNCFHFKNNVLKYCQYK